MARIKQLFDNLDREYIYPITKASAVYDDNNNSVLDLLSAITTASHIEIVGLHTLFSSSEDIYAGIFLFRPSGLTNNTVIFIETDSADETIFSDIRVRGSQHYIWYSKMLFNCTDAYVDTEAIGSSLTGEDVEYATKEWTDAEIEEKQLDLATQALVETLNQLIKALQEESIGLTSDYQFVFLEESGMEALTSSNTVAGIIYMGLEELDVEGSADYDDESGYVELSGDTYDEETGYINLVSATYDEETGYIIL